MKRKVFCLVLLSSAAVLRLGLQCIPEPDLADPLGALWVSLGWIPTNPL